MDRGGAAVVEFSATFVGSIMLSVSIAMLVVRWRDVTTTWTAAAAGVALFAGLPLTGAAALAWVGGSRGLRLFSAATVAVYLMTMSPMSAIIGCGGARSADDISVLTANVLRTVSEPEGLAETIAASEADIVVLQEVSAEVYNSLSTNDLLDDYRYWSPAAGAVQFGKRSTVVVVLAKFSARSTDPHELGAAGGVDIVFDLPVDRSGVSGTTMTFTGLHLNAPSHPRNVGPWRDQLASLAERPTTAPAILAGDFNATEDHRPFRRLLDRGWTDVHEPKGCGFGLTFPVNGMLPVPVMRLDHVLVTDHFEVLGVELVDEANKSDHRPVLTHIRFRDR